MIDIRRGAWRGLVTLVTSRDAPPASRRGGRGTDVLVGLAMALLVLAAAAALFAAHRGAGDGRILLVIPLILAPLPLAARYPLTAWRVEYLVVLLTPLVHHGSRWVPVELVVLLVLFCVAGLSRPRPVVWWMWALTMVPTLVWTGPDWLSRLEAAGAVTAVAILTDVTGAWRQTRRDLAVQTEHGAVLAERARIAREMHDVVAHHLSLIAVQAESAPYRIGPLSPRVQGEFGSLSGAARQALTELRRLLGVLRDEQAAERMPQPQLADLPELVGVARRAGVPVELAMPGTLDHIPPGVSLCGYRIAQEALPNARRHAPGADISVAVDCATDTLRLRISNGRAPGQPLSTNGHTAGAGPTGHGLTGMRERAELLGGTLAASPTPDGGFTVTASLPLGEAR